MRSKKVLLAVIFLGIASLVLCVVPITAMTVRLPLAGNTLIFAAPDAKGSIFKICYLHSVDKSMVQGIFTVNSDNQLLLLETRMESVGTGLPIEANECIGKEGKWRVAGREPTVLPELRLRYHKINNLRLQYKGKQLPVKYIRENQLIILQVEKVTLTRYLFHLLKTMFHK
jgi:hypothetical protein